MLYIKVTVDECVTPLVIACDCLSGWGAKDHTQLASLADFSCPNPSLIKELGAGSQANYFAGDKLNYCVTQLCDTRNRNH